MKLLFIRHGEPDYSIDSLTEKGWKEAACLAEKLAMMQIDEMYVSPLGRAKATALPTERKRMTQATELEWLHEFKPRIVKPNEPDEKSVSWDWLPKDWMIHEEFFDRNRWKENPIMKEFHVGEEYERVNACLDDFLKEHGYVREGDWYRVEKANNDTIVFFCHYAITAVMASHLLNLPPMVMLHQFCALPSSITTIVTEERTEGIAQFRMIGYGDVSHLYAMGEEPSFHARFCECYFNKNERH